jgi:hypothetical protein
LADEMAYAILAVGALLAYLTYLGPNNLKAAGGLLKGEMFTYSDPYYKWLGAIIIVALLGYVPSLRPIAVAFLILITLSIVLSHQNSFVTLLKDL